MEMDLVATRQINGDLRIDDASDDYAPLLKIEFCNEFTAGWEDEEKDQILESVVEKMGEILKERNG